MNNFRRIREKLGMTQQALSRALGCSQGNVGHYERGQTVPPLVARKLIKVAAASGVTVSFDDVYAEPAEEAASHGCH